MIGYLTGTVNYKVITEVKPGINKIIVKSGCGVGYVVYLGNNTIERFKKENAGLSVFEVDLFISTDVRENAIDLYGFLFLDELKSFENLITVPGIGPKTALLIVGNFSTHKINEALTFKDVKFFENIMGIGKKTAIAIIEKLGKNSGKKKES